MLSLSTMKDGSIVPSEEDRKKILTQMKVRTTLRSDKSWIQKKSDSEEEKNHSPLNSPLRRRKTTDRLPVSSKVSSLNHRALFEELSSQAEQQSPLTTKPSKKAIFEELSSQAEPHSPVANKPPQRALSEELSSQDEPQSPGASRPCKKSHSTTSPSGYLIRGVFTKMVDKSSPSNTVPNGSQKSAKSASSAPGYRMSTEDYKKLAPYNVKRDTVPDQVDPLVSPDEQQKRTEAASSVLRQTAHKERSYVLSAAKKSNGSAAREAPSFMAKRVDIEDDTGPRSRSQTMPASSWINSRGKSSTFGERRSMWNDQRMSNAASTTSIDTGSRNHILRHSSGYSSAFSHFTSLENSNKQDQDKHHQTSWDESSPKGSVSSPKRSNKQYLEKHHQISWDESSPKDFVSSPKRSEKNEGMFQSISGSEMPDSIFSEDSWEGSKAQDAKLSQNSQGPHISPESSPKRFSFHDRTGDPECAVETHNRSTSGENLDENGADSERCAADQEEGTFSKEIKYGSPSSRTMEELLATAPSHSYATESTDPLPEETYNVATTISNGQDIDLKSPPSSSEEKTTQEATYESPSETEYKKVEAHRAKLGSWSSEGSLSTAGTQIVPQETAKRVESELETVRPTSLSIESNVAPPESCQFEHRFDLDPNRRATFGSSGDIYRMTTNLDNVVCNHSLWENGHRSSPYLNRQASYNSSRTSCGMPPYLSSQPYNTSMPEMNHTMTPCLSNPAFGSGRSFSTSRDGLVTNSIRSHRIPFYKDICDAETRRCLPRPEDRAAFTSSFSAPAQFMHPSASGYDSDPTTSGKTLLFVKESINSTEMSSPRFTSRSLVDLSTMERQNYNSGGYMQSSPPTRPSEDICTYCGREIRNCPKIKIEKLNICCHEFCFRCGICHKPMGDLLDKIFIHRDIVHCDKCYEKLF